MPVPLHSSTMRATSVPRVAATLSAAPPPSVPPVTTGDDLAPFLFRYDSDISSIIGNDDTDTDDTVVVNDEPTNTGQVDVEYLQEASMIIAPYALTECTCDGYEHLMPDPQELWERRDYRDVEFYTASDFEDEVIDIREFWLEEATRSTFIRTIPTDVLRGAIVGHAHDVKYPYGDLPSRLRNIEHRANQTSSSALFAVQFKDFRGEPVLTLRAECSKRAMAVLEARNRNDRDTTLSHSTLTARQVKNLYPDFWAKLSKSTRVVSGRISPGGNFARCFVHETYRIPSRGTTRTRRGYEEWLSSVTGRGTSRTFRRSRLSRREPPRSQSVRGEM